MANYYLPQIPRKLGYKYILRKGLQPFLKTTRVKNQKFALAEKEAVADKIKAAKSYVPSRLPPLTSYDIASNYPN